MIEKYILHMKNIIFLKAVLYFLSIIALSFLLSNFKEDLLISNARYEKALKMFNKSQAKLEAITNSTNEIFETYEKYESVIGPYAQDSCKQRVNIAMDIKGLKEKYNLANPIYVGFTTSFQGEGLFSSRDKVSIKNYDLKVEFTSSSLDRAVEVFKEVFKKTPENTIITSAEFTNNELLNSVQIGNLSVNKRPELVRSRIIMRLRTLSLNEGN